MKRTSEYLSAVKQAGNEYISGKIKNETKLRLKELLFPIKVFEDMANASWGINSEGSKEDYSLVFTKQMAALYKIDSYKGKDIIFDMDYTDIGKRYRIILGKTGANVRENLEEKPKEKSETVIHTQFKIWEDISSGKLNGAKALIKRMYFVEGDIRLMMKWKEYFG